MPKATALPTTSRRAVLAAIAASTLPVVAIPVAAAAGADAELLRLHAELRPLALAYAKATDRWHQKESQFVDFLADQGLSLPKIKDFDKLYELRRLVGVEQRVEEQNTAGEACDAITRRMAAIPATTLAGVRVKLDAVLVEVGFDPDCVFVDDGGHEWPREQLDAFLVDVAALVNRGQA